MRCVEQTVGLVRIIIGGNVDGVIAALTIASDFCKTALDAA